MLLEMSLPLSHHKTLTKVEGTGETLVTSLFVAVAMLPHFVRLYSVTTYSMQQNDCIAVRVILEMTRCYYILL